jgi:hypothetical protein
MSKTGRAIPQVETDPHPAQSKRRNKVLAVVIACPLSFYFGQRV